MCVSVPKECVCPHPTEGLKGGEISCTYLGCSHPTGGLQGGEIRNCFSKGGGCRKPSSGSDGANTLIKQILENR